MGGFVDNVKEGLFGSDIGKIDPVMGLWSGYGSGFKDMFDDISGNTAADAANDAAKLQYQAMMAGIDAQTDARKDIERNLKPFMNVGNKAIPAYNRMLTTGGQYDYLKNNPMFMAAVNNSANQMKGIGAARGKYNSGGTVNQLFQNYLATGNDYINGQFNRLNSAVGIGQNSAAMQGTNVQNSASNIASMLGQGANAMAAGGIGAANAQAQGTQNMVGLIAAAAPYFMASDQRMKENVKIVGHDEDGLDIIEYNYIGQPERWRGYSAQQVRNFAPEFVAENDDGYLMVTGKYLPKRVA